MFLILGIINFITCFFIDEDVLRLQYFQIGILFNVWAMLTRYNYEKR